MGAIKITHKGNFDRNTRFLNRLREKRYFSILEEYGKKGVEALSAATPVDTGRTAESWSYNVDKTGSGYEISWYNNSQNKGISIVILNQYGHATRNGGWVKGIDFINPAIQPIFERMADEIWREVNE